MKLMTWTQSCKPKKKKYICYFSEIVRRTLSDVPLFKKIISFWLNIASNFCKAVTNSLIDPNELL